MAGMQRARSGFSLVELVVSMGLVTLIVAALGSTFVIAAHALPNGKQTIDLVNRAAGVAVDIDEDLRTAVYLTERSPNAVTFVVADRNGDGLPEVIRYAWSGTPGDPLTLRYNNGSAVIQPDVYQFNLSYEQKNLVETYAGPLVESGEVELISHNSSSNLGEAHVHGNPHSIGFWSQYFKPTLPVGTVSWTVSRVLFNAMEDNEAVPTTIELAVPAADQTPSATIVDSATLNSGELAPGYLWIQKSFSSAVGLDPAEGLCLVFSSANNRSARLRYRNSNVTLPDVGLSEGTPAWGPVATDEALLFYVYGTTVAPATAQTVTRDYVSAVRMQLQVGGNAGAAVQTSVQMLNMPEALTAVWDTQFDADPTQMDLDLDAVADWEVDFGSFDASDLVDGVWHVPTKRLQTLPAHDFSQLTTVDLRCRDTAANGYPMRFRIYFDRIGGSCAIITFSVELESDNTQTVNLTNHITSMTKQTLISLGGLTSTFKDVRLVLDPGPDTATIFLDGQHKGTFTYARVTANSAHARLRSPSADGEVEHVRIRVGGTGS